MRIAVAGGTGVVGRHVVELLRSSGHDPVVLTRSYGVDLVQGTGLDAALDGCSVVIDVSGVTTLSRRRAVAFFDRVSRHLLDAGRRSGVTHHIALSVVGCDRVAMGYYLGKRRQEELVLSGAVPGTVLRATQFHEFAGQLLAGSRGPLAVVPRMRSQPVAAREAAAELVSLAQGPPLGLAPELAGPEVLEMVDLVGRLRRATGDRRVVLPVQLPGAVGRAMAGGALLPTGPGPRGTQVFEDWLVERPG